MSMRAFRQILIAVLDVLAAAWQKAVVSQTAHPQAAEISHSNQSARKNDKASPNFIIIYMDDMGYGDVGQYQSLDLALPVIDDLAAREQDCMGIKWP